MEFLTIYFGMLVAYIMIDFLWISFFMQPYFSANLSHLLRESIGTGFLIFYGSLFFIFYVFGLYWFGVRSGIAANSILTATLSGALLGFIAYGTYGLTNFIFFKGYPIQITVLDISWGTLLGGFVSFLGYMIYLQVFYGK